PDRCCCPICPASRKTCWREWIWHSQDSIVTLGQSFFSGTKQPPGLESRSITIAAPFAWRRVIGYLRFVRDDSEASRSIHERLGCPRCVDRGGCIRRLAVYRLL